MTAEDTARQVLRWAAADVQVPIPTGDLTDAVRLAEPGREVLGLIGRLTALTAARMRLRAPLFGDQRRPGVGAALLAAAIGAFQHGEQARSVLGAARLQTARPSARAADLLACHGVVAPALRLLPGLADPLRDASPLTGALDRPGPRTEGACGRLVERLVADPAGRSVVVARFARPPETPQQAVWRGECLAAARHVDPDFVVEVYETALLHHGRQHEILVRTAWRHVLGRGSSEPALPTASWWRALAELEAATPHRLRGMALFDVRRDGANLFRRMQAWETHEHTA